MIGVTDAALIFSIIAAVTIMRIRKIVLLPTLETHVFVKCAANQLTYTKKDTCRIGNEKISPVLLYLSISICYHLILNV
jgi:hypothetical protein